MTGGCHGTIVSPLASRVAFSVKLREMRSTGPSRLRQESGSPGGFPSEADRLPCQSKKCQQQVGRGVPPSRGMSLIAFLDAALIGPAIRHGNGMEMCWQFVHFHARIAGQELFLSMNIKPVTIGILNSQNMAPQHRYRNSREGGNYEPCDQSDKLGGGKVQFRVCERIFDAACGFREGCNRRNKTWQKACSGGKCHSQ